MILNKNIDDRDALGKMRRRQLVELAHANGHRDITETMPADDYTDENGRVTPGIRSLLRQRGVHGVRTTNRQLGSLGRHETRPIAPRPAPAPTAAKPPAVADAEWAEFQRWKASQQAAPSPTSNPPKRLVERPRSEINQLRDKCKELGIKMERRDNMERLKAKIAAYGQDAPQLRQ